MIFLLDEQHFQMVVVVHKSVKHIWDVKGKRFCHPGLETDKDWTKIFSTVSFTNISRALIEVAVAQCYRACIYCFSISGTG